MRRRTARQLSLSSMSPALNASFILVSIRRGYRGVVVSGPDLDFWFISKQFLMVTAWQ